MKPYLKYIIGGIGIFILVTYLQHNWEQAKHECCKEWCVEFDEHDDPSDAIDCYQDCRDDEDSCMPSYGEIFFGI